MDSFQSSGPSGSQRSSALSWDLDFEIFASDETVLRQASVWNRFWRDRSKLLRKDSVEISTARQLRRSLGPLPETFARTAPNFRSEKSLQELFQSGGWLEDCLKRLPQTSFKAKNGLRDFSLARESHYFYQAISNPSFTYRKTSQPFFGRNLIRNFFNGELQTKQILSNLQIQKHFESTLRASSEFRGFVRLELSCHHSLFSVHMLFLQVLLAFIHRFFFSKQERQFHRINLTLTTHYLNSRANDSRIAPITFTYSLQSRE